MSSEQMRPNLLTVVPGNINIENFVPGRVYKETLMIYNTYNVPIVLNLKSSDKNKLTISESKMRIGVNQSKKLDLIIQDKLNYKYTKTPVKLKKLFIHMKGDLIDEKYEINLIYYQKNNPKNNINNMRIQNNQNIINNQGVHMKNKYSFNNPNNGYLTENPNNHLNYENNSENIPNSYQNTFYEEFKTPIQNRNYTDQKNQSSYMSIEKNDNEEIVALKNIINDLLNKINNLTPLLNQCKSNQLYHKNQLSISHNFFYIFGNNTIKEIHNKYKIDDNIDNERLISRNKILELENSTLLFRIKCLEKKLSLNKNKNEEEDEKMIEQNLYGNENIDKNEVTDNIIYQSKNKLDNYNKNIKNNLNKSNLNDNNDINNKSDTNNYLYKNMNNQDFPKTEYEKPIYKLNNIQSVYGMKNEPEVVYKRKYKINNDFNNNKESA